MLFLFFIQKVERRVVRRWSLPDVKIRQGGLSLLIEIVELLRRSAMDEDEVHLAVEFIGDEVGHLRPWSVHYC